MKERLLPDWVERAVDLQDAEGLRPRLVRRWREIETDVLPALSPLHHREKTQVFERALWAGKYWQRTETESHREALIAAKDLLSRIAIDASDLAARLNTLEELAEKNELGLDTLSLWETIEIAAREPGYADWRCVVEEHGHWQDFFHTAQTQYRPNPSLAHLLEVFAGHLQWQAANVSSAVASALNSRKRSTDSVRILLKQLDNNSAYSLRAHSFTLPDQAIATLAAVLFDLDPPPSASAIKMLRARMNQNG